jgi:hypothetical protein
MGDLDTLEACGVTSVGWCRLTPPYATVNERGNPSVRHNGLSEAGLCAAHLNYKSKEYDQCDR